MESDEGTEAVEEEQVKVEEAEEDDEIIESDVELEGETVEPDHDPPQKVRFSCILNFSKENSNQCSKVIG